MLVTATRRASSTQKSAAPAFLRAWRLRLQLSSSPTHAQGRPTKQYNVLCTGGSSCKGAVSMPSEQFRGAGCR
eukprot:3532727-Prymnesium_polylepis.1